MGNESMESMLTPVSDAAPCGSDLEYDPAFTALEEAARFTAEQQFGDSVIPEVSPDWRSVSAQAMDLMKRTKDVRIAVLALRAFTRLQGVEGLVVGLRALQGMLERYWDGIHPQLDADDGNDPTMRLNALAPLTDSDMVLRDLHDAKVGTSRSLGPILVRDVELAFGKLTAKEGEAVLSVTQIEGALREIFEAQPAARDACAAAADCVAQLQSVINERVGGADAVNFKPLRDIAYLMAQMSKNLGATPAGDSGDAPVEEDPVQSGGAGAGAQRPATRGEVASRQDALDTLDRVIRYLEQSEPGNPAPLLIKRAKRLIGVSFLDIMADLAPDALSSIENITGRPS